MSEFHRLPLLPAGLEPALPRVQRRVRLHDRALSLFTDLRLGPKVVAETRDALDPTLHVMLRAGVHMAFVADPAGRLVGLVTQADLQGERPLLSALSDGRAHGELTVGDLMTPIGDWPMVDLFEIRHASIGDVVQTLEASGLRYLLVSETRDGATELRGLFSARALEEALDRPIENDRHSRSFAQLEAALAHGIV